MHPAYRIRHLITPCCWEPEVVRQMGLGCSSKRQRQMEFYASIAALVIAVVAAVTYRRTRTANGHRSQSLFLLSVGAAVLAVILIFSHYNQDDFRDSHRRLTFWEFWLGRR